MSGDSAVQMKITLSGSGPGEGQGTGDLGTKVPAQNYEKLRRSCIQKKQLFEDPYFPADDRSLFFSQKLPFKPQWKRPKDIVADPKLFTGGADRFDVKQGLLGDCWLVAAIASLTQDRILMKQVIPEGQDFSKGYAGIFRFRFWHFGEWVDVVIDDRLPTHNGKLIFIHSQDENEFWSALLEKAYAKLYGGFESLKGGKTSEAMTDFTGGVVEHYELSKAPDDLFKQMKIAENRSSLMSCSIKTTTRAEVEAKLETGLVKGHAYSITGIAVVNSRGKDVELVRIRNPWGQKEWNGAWSDDSDMWKTISEVERKRLEATKSDDGEFWMAFPDFKKHFTDIELCSVSIDQMYEDEQHISWDSVVINGAWEGDRAGGCRNNATFTNNPQYVIDLKEDADGDGKCSVLIALMQKHRRKQKKMGAQDLCIGYSIYKAPSADCIKVDKKFVDYNRSTGTSGSFTNAREVMKRFDLEPGRYIIIPCNFKPDEEGDFLLRIFTEAFPDDQAPGGDSASGTSTEDPRKAALRKNFDQLAGKDQVIDAYELQDILTASLTKNSSDAVFSLDACRSMIAMLDENKNGVLEFDEFCTLLETIGTWKKMFFKFDKDRSGTLERNEVFSAIKSLGYNLSAENISVLFNRFAKRRRYMNIDDFAACLCRVKIMHDMCQKHSVGGKVELTQDAFFNITLDA